MITPAFLTFAAVVGFADYLGPGHDWGGLAVLTGWFFLCRSLSPRGWRWLWIAAMVLSVAVAALAVVQVALWMPRARGPFTSPNFLGAHAVLMFFLAVAGQSLAGKWSLVPMSAAASLLSLALSQSRGALLALGAGLLVLAARGRSWPLLAAVAACGTVVFLIRPETTNPRLAIWRIGWQAAQQRLLLGWGQGGAVVGGLDHFYNIPLDILVAGGILALAAGAWLLLAACRSACRYERVTNPTRRVPPEIAGDCFGPPIKRTAPLVRQIGLPKGHALLAFLAAWVVQGMFLSGTPATWMTLVAVLAYLASSSRRRLMPFRITSAPLSSAAAEAKCPQRRLRRTASN